MLGLVDFAGQIGIERTILLPSLCYAATPASILVLGRGF